MISAASFNYYQEVHREAKDIPHYDLSEICETDEPVEAHRVFQEYMMVPWSVFACDVE